MRTTKPVPDEAFGLLLACLEALRGMRALHQVRAHMAQPAFEGLIAGRSDGGLEDVGAIRLQMPTPTAVEVTAMGRRATRWLACVLRLDSDTAYGWTCTDFRVVG